MVARDGIEPPTPAFSGPDTAVVILLNPFGLTVVSITFRARLLEHIGTGF